MLKITKNRGQQLGNEETRLPYTKETPGPIDYQFLITILLCKEQRICQQKCFQSQTSTYGAHNKKIM